MVRFSNSSGMVAENIFKVDARVGWHFPWAGFDCDACRALVDFLDEFLKPGKDEVR
jgi:hypothetical protein